MPNPIGVNTAGINQDLVLGKSVSNTGQGIPGKTKALEQARALPGSELVYRDKQGDWQVAPLKEDGVLLGADPLKSTDKNEIVFDKKALAAQGIEHQVISFVDERASLEELVRISSDPKAPKDLLASLPSQAAAHFETGMQFFNRYHMGHPNPRLDDLNRMMFVREFPDLMEVRQLTSNLIANPNTPPEALSELVRLGQEYEHQAQGGLYPPEGQERLPCLPVVPMQFEALAKHPGFDSKHLLSLLDSSIGGQIASHPQIKGADLDHLLKSPKADLRYGAARNPSLPQDVLAELSLDLDPKMRRAIAENPATPEKILKELAKDPEDRVSRAAQKRLR